MKKMLVVVVLLVIAVVVVVVRSNDRNLVIRVPSAVVTPSPTSHPEALNHEYIATHEYAAKGRVPAYYKTPPDITKLPPTLSPELFTGNERLAYQAAKAIPVTLSQLPCYCHCDRGHGHNSLHSCFESEHGENCGICIGEALMALSLQKRGMDVGEIRKQIIAAYGQSGTK